MLRDYQGRSGEARHRFFPFFPIFGGRRVGIINRATPTTTGLWKERLNTHAAQNDGLNPTA